MCTACIVSSCCNIHAYDIPLDFINETPCDHYSIFTSSLSINNTLISNVIVN